MVEIHAQAVIKSILELCQKLDNCRLAEPGEFTR